MKTGLISIARQLYEFGVDIRKFLSTFRIYKYMIDLTKWLWLGGKVHGFHIVLGDYSAPAGTSRGHYFHQDLLVAQHIFHDMPKSHVDIGSRIDGFVAHVATFRQITVVDVRTLKPSIHGNIKFLQADLMADGLALKADSVSCLHALEHFGLGRYGDPISVDGFIVGLKNICSIVQPQGKLYLSFPIGSRNKVIFNAHRVFDPQFILSVEPIKSQFELISFNYVDDNGDLHKSVNLLEQAPICEYGCGIYVFNKINNL